MIRDMPRLCRRKLINGLLRLLYWLLFRLDVAGKENVRDWSAILMINHH